MEGGNRPGPDRFWAAGAVFGWSFLFIFLQVENGNFVWLGSGNFFFCLRETIVSRAKRRSQYTCGYVLKCEGVGVHLLR